MEYLDALTRESSNTMLPMEELALFGIDPFSLYRYKKRVTDRIDEDDEYNDDFDDTPGVVDEEPYDEDEPEYTDIYDDEEYDMSEAGHFPLLKTVLLFNSNHRKYRA